MNYPKVLIIANTPFSLTNNNGKTYYSFFKGWPKNKIAQIYFNNELPLYSITEKYFNFKERNIEKNSIKEDIYVSEKLWSDFRKSIANKIKNIDFIYPLYNEYWKLKIFKNEKKYESFIEDFKPQIIFFVGGNRSFSYDLINKIYKKYSIPYCIYYTDDYFVPQNNNLSIKINQYLFLKSAKLSIENSCKLFVIGEKMKTIYLNVFEKQCVPLMNSIDFEKYKDIRHINPRKNIVFSYFGGLHLKRIDTLKALGKQIDKFNKTYGYKYQLEIYSQSYIEASYQKTFNEVKCINFKGSVNSEEIIKTMERSDVLVFVESFNKEMINRTRLSLSTKIPEYLAVGKQILAIGPDESGSIEYLKALRNPIVITSQSPIEIEKGLFEIYHNLNNSREVFNQNRDYVFENHSYQSSHQILKRELCKCLD